MERIHIPSPLDVDFLSAFFGREANDREYFLVLACR